MASAEDREVARLWRVNRTVKEMVRDRGYLLADFELELSLDDFKQRHGSDRAGLSFQSLHGENQTAIYVFFCPEPAVSKAQIKNFIAALDKHSATRGILIYSEKLSSIANKTIQEMNNEYTLESFSESELLVNITKHFLVPKHQIMSPAEKKELTAKYRLKDTQLPRIMMTDPVARYYGMKRGQVMRIERESETAGRYITYRICM